MKSAFSIVLAAAALAAAPMVLAQEAPTPEEQARQARLAHMNLYAHNLGPLGAMAKGEMAYDADMAATRASNIAQLGRIDQSSYWLEGTDSFAMDDSRALPAIWDNMPDMVEKQQVLVEAAEAAAQAAPEGQQAFAAAFGELGKSCGGCHEDYRQPDD